MPTCKKCGADDLKKRDFRFNARSRTGFDSVCRDCAEAPRLAKATKHGKRSKAYLNNENDEFEIVFKPSQKLRKRINERE